jgi:hypothetical protein
MPCWRILNRPWRPLRELHRHGRQSYSGVVDRCASAACPWRDVSVSAPPCVQPSPNVRHSSEPFHNAACVRLALSVDRDIADHPLTLHFHDVDGPEGWRSLQPRPWPGGRTDRADGESRCEPSFGSRSRVAGLAGALHSRACLKSGEDASWGCQCNLDSTYSGSLRVDSRCEVWRSVERTNAPMERGSGRTGSRPHYPKNRVEEHRQSPTRPALPQGERAQRSKQ